MKTVRIRAALVAAMMIGAATPALADVKAGVDAWSRGDYRQAVEEWRGPAIAGDADAQFNLGQAYKLGRGVPADMAQAEEWYRRAAEQGHVQAQDNYGLALFQNNKRDKAVPFLEKSAARGEPRAQYVLGTMLFNGDAVKRDWVRAYALMSRSAAADLPQAQAALGQMDKYIAPTERQRGTELARRYESEMRRSRLAPVDAAAAPPVASRPAPGPRPAATSSPPVRSEAVKATAPVPTRAPRDGGWRVQLGAFRDPDGARRLWSEVAGRFAGRQPAYPRAGALTRLVIGPYASQAEAQRACAALKPCVPTR